jgi:hypothetical protein
MQKQLGTERLVAPISGEPLRVSRIILHPARQHHSFKQQSEHETRGRLVKFALWSHGPTSNKVHQQERRFECLNILSEISMCTRGLKYFGKASHRDLDLVIVNNLRTGTT